MDRPEEEILDQETYSKYELEKEINEYELLEVQGISRIISIEKGKKTESISRLIIYRNFNKNFR